MDNRSITRLAIICFFCLRTIGVGAQTSSPCPPNLDFELANLSQWQFFSGNCCPINTPNFGIIPGRHDLTYGPAKDPHGNFPIVAPGGGNFSLKLGNDSVGKQAERAIYYINVPAAPGKYVFVYRYAIVLQDPNHDPKDQPRFQVMAFDSLTGTPLDCNERNYVSSSNLPGFMPAPGSTDIYYKSWTTATLNLSAYNGQTVGIEFSTGDCALGGHFGYGYVDMNCGLFQINITQCGNAPNAILKGPPGYQYYQWMDFNFSSVLGTTQDITVPTPPGPTYFVVIATPYQGFGCTDTFYTEYNIVHDNMVAKAPDVQYCKGGIAQLFVGTSNSYGPFLFNWWPAAGLNCTTCSNPQAAPLVNTTYYVSVENSNGCIDTEDVLVIVNPKPVADAGRDTTLCRGAEVTLQGSGGVNYKWYPGGGLSNSSISDPVATVAAGQTIYHLIVKNKEGCADTDDVAITPFPSPVSNAGNDSTLCYGAIVRLNGSGGGKYKWFPANGLSDPNIANPLVTVKDTTVYYLEVTNEHGCADTSAIAFTTFRPDPFHAGTDTSICIGDTAHLFASGGQAYTWLSDYNIADTLSPVTTVWPIVNTVYTVHIKDSLCNRQDTLPVKITMNPLHILKVVATPVVCGGDIGQLTAYGGKNYTWYPTDGLSDPNSNITKAHPRTSTFYTVVGINGYGCVDTASAMLDVYGDDGMFVPDAFTPNGDGLNDCFHFIVTGDVVSFDLHIYNRWGEEVFHSTNYGDCWDGTYKGEKLDLGTFYYFCKAKTPLCGDILKKGDIQLVR